MPQPLYPHQLLIWNLGERFEKRKSTCPCWESNYDFTDQSLFRLSYRSKSRTENELLLLRRHENVGHYPKYTRD